MIVKFLSKSESFKGVNYNTNKAEQGKGELVAVQNFGALQGIENLRPQDYINYLKAVSAQNKRVKFPQLHVAISCKGREKGKNELIAIAKEWMEGMGYGNQPYLLVFHTDTANNHIHIVSTRVGRDGKKIDDSFEKLRAYQVLNRILGKDEGKQAAEDIKQALSYRFSTRAQFILLLENRGYSLHMKEVRYLVCKFGKEQGAVATSRVDARIGEYEKDEARVKQLRSIIDKYRMTYDPSVYEKKAVRPGNREGKIAGYSSELAEHLHQKFGLEAIFHAKEGKPPYGYTLVDHAKKAVYKGGEIMSLRRFTEQGNNQSLTSPVASDPLPAAQKKQDAGNAAITLSQRPETDDTGFPGAGTGEEEREQEHYQPWEQDPDSLLPFLIAGVEIADDIDDEAIHGRNRRKKRKARTNTR